MSRGCLPFGLIAFATAAIVGLVAFFMAVPGEPLVPAAPTETVSGGPPEAMLVTVAGVFDLHRGSFCWIDLNVETCESSALPQYAEADYILLPADIVMELLFTPPFPSGGSVTLQQSSDDETMTDVASAALQPDIFGSFVWRPAVPPGNYTLVVAAHWDGEVSGEAIYTLPITIEG